MRIRDSNRPIAEEVMSIITERCLKQSAVAEKAGYSSQTFNDMLKGRRVIRACDIANLAMALGVTPNELYGIKETDRAS